ncbi:MAG: cellulase family glycosylhydrolase [Lachnospiraceae bacterium]|nr:cellulase family glycosylhydrolase [Lachnospiraceae bacterium]
MEKLFIKGTRFVTASGKEVLLHGENVLCRDASLHHFYPDFEEKAFPYFRKMGFNFMRFGIFWDAAEPEPGCIDRAYLNRVKQIVRTAEENGIYVVLDMHQDLFAAKFIDGAPDWACLDEGLPHPEHCDLWYEAYLSSEAIIRAADNFWANAPAADGTGLLDHYEKMWEAISETFSDCDNVIGFEPMNEPFMGSLARESFGMAAMHMAEKGIPFDLSHPENITPEAQVEFMGIVAGRFLEFDRTVLMDFYRRMQKAVRKHSDKPIVTGGNIYCSTDIPTGIEKLSDGLQIYAPHGYDSVVDSDRYELYNKDNVARLFAHKKEAQDRLGLPTVVGEWGAFPSRDFTNDLIRFMNGILEENLWGDAYCEYQPGQEQDANFSALCRAYPMEISGSVTSFHADEASLTLTYEAVPGESRVFLPFIPKHYPYTAVSENTCICTLPSAEGTVHLVIA